MEIVKGLSNILFVQQIKVYIDPMNLTYKTFTTEQVMQWRLILVEYNPELIYIQGFKNITADALSRLDEVDIPNPVKNNIISINEHYGLEDEDISRPTKRFDNNRIE